MFKNEITIRLMRTDDLDSIFQLERLWKEEEVSYIYEPFTQDELQTTMMKFNDYHLVAIQQNELVGYINGILEDKGKERVFKRREQFLMIENLYVKENFRNRQIGGLLLEEVLKKARSNGITKFAVATDTKDMDSILRFYGNHGFKPFFVELYKIDML